jgi:hypothetical protein
MSHVTLHRDKGVNPFLTICRACGKDVGLVLVGVREWVDTCDKCGMKHYGGADNRECKGCKEHGATFTRRKLEEREKIPIEICDDCRKSEKDFDEKLEAMARKEAPNGAILFRCKCGNKGLIGGHAEIAKLVREKLNIKPPALCGVDLDECTDCRETAEGTVKDGKRKG